MKYKAGADEGRRPKNSSVYFTMFQQNNVVVCSEMSSGVGYALGRHP